MATDHSERTAEDPTAGPTDADTEPPGIAHLTVVPENAERSS